MILSQEQRELFYLLYDSITVFANERLKVTDHMFYGDPQMVDEYEQTKVAMELWKAPSLVEEFMKSEEAEALMPDELDQLAGWSSALQGTFAVVVQPNGRALFLSDGHAFEVVGISREIGELLGRTPTFVNATLLPFEGLIVYGGYLDELPSGRDERASALLQMQVQSTLATGEVVRTAEGFIACSADISELRVQREVDSMLEDLDALSDESGVPGTHKGMLAGLSPSERKAKAEAHAAEADNLGPAGFERALAEAALPGEPFDDLADLLLTHTKQELESFARAWKLNGVSSLSKAALADRLVPAMSEDAGTLRLFLGYCSAGQVGSLAALVGEGGRRDLEVSTMKSQLALAAFPLFFEPFVYAFLHGGTLTEVVPRELMGVMSSLDWGEIGHGADVRGKVADFAESLSELRGIVEVQEAYDEFERVYPSLGVGFEDFRGLLEDLASSGRRDFEILESGNVNYLIFYDLADEYRDALERCGGMRGLSGDRAYLHGPLSPMLNSIIENRRGKVARPLEEGMEKRGGVLEWELALPPVLALRSFFDANVPDGKDDFGFADEMVDLFVTMAHGGYAPQDFFDALDEHGFSIDERHLKRFMQLVQNMVGAVPSWFENGWSPVEMVEMQTGLKTFYDEFGSPMKIGKNDPCPCGSGKMYKDCHGRLRR